MSTLFNRRNFLKTGAGAGVASLLPLSGKGTPIELANGDIGKSKWDLDSPALCVDLDKMEQNIKSLQSRLQGTGVAARPHGKTHRCPAIAKMQIDAGAVGICTQVI